MFFSLKINDHAALFVCSKSFLIEHRTMPAKRVATLNEVAPVQLLK